jgi:CRP/FNR family cyclic AMP-dependent transcriptional regulator
MAERRPRRSLPLPLILASSGREILRQGEICLEPRIVHVGALITIAVSPEGQALALGVLGPGDLVSGPVGVASTFSARALRPSQLRPAVGEDLGPLEAERSRRMAELACELAWLDVTTRIEHRLVDLAVRFGRPVGGGLSVPWRLSQEDLAALAGTTRESANRSIRRLVGTGRISVVKRSRYLVHPRLRLVPP